MPSRTPSTHRRARRLGTMLWIACAVLFSTAAIALPNPTMSGPSTTDPAGFLDVAGLAPNATPYCDSPTYFDFWTLGSDADGGVAGTTDTGPGGVALTLTDRSGVGDGLRVTAPDHGVIFDDGDDGTVTLDQPMFYTQWVFVDIDLSSEGFAATGCVGGDAQCVGGTPAAGVAVMAQNTSFAGGMVSTDQSTGFASYQIGPGSRLGPTTIDSRMQIDFLGAVDTLFLDKIGTGGAGFAVGGGCEPIGVAKSAGEPMANGFGSFVIPFTVRVLNNLPDAARLSAVLSAAEVASSAGQFSGPTTPPEIPIQNLQVTEDLAAVFGVGTFTVTNLSTGALTPNPAGFDGDAEPEIRWMKDNLFSGPVNSILTVVAVGFIAFLLAELMPWLID
ncbi:MAG: hypothetical protein AAGE94_23135, partial [Acidobacteriota bacterium]